MTKVVMALKDVLVYSYYLIVFSGFIKVVAVKPLDYFFCICTHSADQHCSLPLESFLEMYFGEGNAGRRH